MEGTQPVKYGGMYSYSRDMRREGDMGGDSIKGKGDKGSSRGRKGSRPRGD